MDFKKYDIANMQQLMNFFQNNMKYGFTHKNRIYLEEGADFSSQMDKYYKLRIGEDFIKSGYGVCWDFCEFERSFCEQMNITHECYFFLSFLKGSECGPTHTFLIFEQNNKWYWFEYAWKQYRGIWEYPNKLETLNDILNKFCKYNDISYEKVEVYKTKKVKDRLNASEFIEHCLSGKKIDLKSQ